jgi:hypothetical protein
MGIMPKNQQTARCIQTNEGLETQVGGRRQATQYALNEPQSISNKFKSCRVYFRRITNTSSTGATLPPKVPRRGEVPWSAHFTELLMVFARIPPRSRVFLQKLQLGISSGYVKANHIRFINELGGSIRNLPTDNKAVDSPEWASAAHTIPHRTSPGLLRAWRRNKRTQKRATDSMVQQWPVTGKNHPAVAQADA